MKRIKDYFSAEYPYVDIDGLDESVIREYMSRSYIDGLGFSMQMNCLYDYILSQDLCNVDE